MAKFYAPTQLSENIRETPEGFLLCLNVPIARTGEMIYGENETPLEAEDGKVIVDRDASEVFHPDTIASFQGKAITIRHPEEFVDPSNWNDLAKGIIQNVRKADEKDENGEEILLADLLIMSNIAIQLVKNGLREVSCGYEAEYEQTSKGRGKQTRIIGNHLALVDAGRAGESYAINDHKGKNSMSKVSDQLRKIFGKVIDETMAEEKKSKDEDKEEKKDDKAKDSSAYDELVKMVKDLGEKIDGMGKSKDEDKEEEKPESKDEEEMDEDKEEKSKDEGEEKKEESKDDDKVEKSMEDRLKALEMAVEKLLEKENAESGDEEEMGDEDMPKKKTGDSTGLENTKNSQAFGQEDSPKNHLMTPEKINELNAAHWARK